MVDQSKFIFKCCLNRIYMLILLVCVIPLSILIICSHFFLIIITFIEKSFCGQPHHRIVENLIRKFVTYCIFLKHLFYKSSNIKILKRARHKQKELFTKSLLVKGSCYLLLCCLRLLLIYYSLNLHAYVCFISKLGILLINIIH